MITATIIDITPDENGNIKVVTDYKDKDNVLVQRGVTRYSSYQDETEEELIERIKAEIDSHCKELIRRKHFRSKNHTAISSLKTKLAGHERKHEHAEHNFGPNKRKVVLNEKEIVEVKDI